MKVDSSANPHGAFIHFFFNDTATTEIYTLSLHDALPIYRSQSSRPQRWHHRNEGQQRQSNHLHCFRCICRCSTDRKSTRLNSSHVEISYAVFCLKKKKDV